MTQSKALSGQSVLLASILLLSVFLSFAILPVRAEAACTELQTYPPRVVCTSESGSGSNTGSTVGSTNTGDVVSSSNNTQETSYAPVAFWKFDESSGAATDSSGNGNTGVLENGATRYVGTQQGNKLLLDGNDDRVIVTPVSGSASNMGSFTLMAWVRPTENGGIIVRKGNTDVGRFNFGITYQGKLYLRAGYSGQSGAWNTSSSLPLNKWSHVAVTYSFGTGNDPVFYIGASPAGSSEIQMPSGDAVADTSHIYLGNTQDLVNRAQDGFTSGFSGRMDNVRIYNAALTNAAITAARTPEPDLDDYTPIPFPAAVVATTQGDSVANLQARLQALLAQMATLTDSSGTPSLNAACPALVRSLFRGSRGDEVTQLQKFLMAKAFLAAGNDSGYFGALTEAAVKKWQASKGIDAIGTVGPRTRSALKNCTL